METVWERIRAIFEESGLNQAQFARALKISPTYCSYLLNGQRTPPPRTILIIGEIFGYRPEWIETGEGEKKVDDVADEIRRLVEKFNLSETSEKMLKMYLTLDAKRRVAFENFVLSMMSNEEIETPKNDNFDKNG